MTDWLDDRSLVERVICGAIRSALHDHPPGENPAVTAASAAKRVYGQLKTLRREHNKRKENECPQE